MEHPQIKSKGDQEQRPASWEKHLKRVVSKNQRVSGTLCEGVRRGHYQMHQRDQEP